MRDSMIITFALLIFVFATTFATWLEEEGQKIDALNTQYTKDIEKLRTVAQINAFLDNHIMPFTSDKQCNSIMTDKKLIDFFDDHQNRYNLLVEKFIYESDAAKNLDLSYTIERGNKEVLNDFLHIKHKDGFLQFRKLKLNTNELNGMIQVVQPYGVQNGLSQDIGAEDDLPQ